MEAKKLKLEEADGGSADVRSNGATSEQLLIQRAKRMANRSSELSAQETNRSNSESILIFMLGGERFAFRMTAVSAVVPLAKLTVVPTADPRILGAMVVKGEVYCIFDLTRVLELPRATAGDHGGYVVVLRMPGYHIGFCVDQVEAIDGIDDESSSREELAHGRSFVKPRTTAALILIDNFESLLGTLLHEENQA